ncbi:hypothetical protein B0J12DRAFT_287621 [Macrophomina phaseolina]|uniref:Uncharacterized protein n=1 Tax=Macrophomina phaseolina TaxID=35725 RepID=A0ABQ8GNV9_9PEZI|nr:hypothetical protein B0J12DRAFT_287621 [Macrophomina phaseolina]
MRRELTILRILLKEIGQPWTWHCIVVGHALRIDAKAAFRPLGLSYIIEAIDIPHQARRALVRRPPARGGIRAIHVREGVIRAAATRPVIVKARGRRGASAEAGRIRPGAGVGRGQREVERDLSLATRRRRTRSSTSRAISAPHGARPRRLDAQAARPAAPPLLQARNGGSGAAAVLGAAGGAAAAAVGARLVVGVEVEVAVVVQGLDEARAARALRDAREAAGARRRRQVARERGGGDDGVRAGGRVGGRGGADGWRDGAGGSHCGGAGCGCCCIANGRRRGRGGVGGVYAVGLFGIHGCSLRSPPALSSNAGAALLRQQFLGGREGQRCGQLPLLSLFQEKLTDEELSESPGLANNCAQLHCSTWEARRGRWCWGPSSEAPLSESAG